MRENPSIAIYALIVMVVVLVALAWRPASSQDCEVGSFGCGHEQMHPEYSDWKQKGSEASCCHNTDCRPVRARATFDGVWQIYIPEFRRWVDVPASAMQEPDRFHDGRSHACTADPTNWLLYSRGAPLPVYCFSPTGTKS